MNDLPHSLDRSLVIRAPRDLVFRYFTDSERFARWWGAGSRIEGRVGGAVHIVYPNGVVARGTITALDAGRRVVFTYGYEDPQKPIPVGGSLVTITLHDHADGTRLELRHDFAGAAARDQHVPGWRFQLALFTNAVADEAHGAVEGCVDAWFAAWSERDAARRRELLVRCTTDDVRMQDRWSCLAGRTELLEHMAVCMVHAPGSIRRTGPVRQCQARALVDWVITDPAGGTRGQGTNVIELAADGRIAGVTGFW